MWLANARRWASAITSGVRTKQSGDAAAPPIWSPARSKQRGLSLLECAAALSLAGLVLASATQTNSTAATIVRRTLQLNETVDVVRNLIEHELGAPCGAAFECPSGFRCNVARVAVNAALDRIVATVEPDDAATAEELRTLAPAANCAT